MPPLIPTVAVGVALALAAGGTTGYRLGRANADREAVARVEGERNAWRKVADDALGRERTWLASAAQIQSRWEVALTDIRALQVAPPPRTIREVIREGQSCPDVSVDPDTFRVLDVAVAGANRARATPQP